MDEDRYRRMDRHVTVLNGPKASLEQRHTAAAR